VLVTHAAVAPGGNDLLNLCILELRPGGVFRDLADLGSAARAPSAGPTAWTPVAGKAPDRLVFVGPAPGPPSSGGGPFDFFGAFSALLASSAPPSGLFMADVEVWGLEAVQPRRVGTAINLAGPVWRSENALYSFARQGRRCAGAPLDRPDHWVDARSGGATAGGHRAGCSAGRPMGFAPLIRSSSCVYPDRDPRRGSSPGQRRCWRTACSQ
jgi:hypothetical protein